MLKRFFGETLKSELDFRLYLKINKVDPEDVRVFRKYINELKLDPKKYDYIDFTIIKDNIELKVYNKEDVEKYLGMLEDFD